MACSTGLAILNGASTGTTIPDADKHGVWNHLAAHLKDAGVKEADLLKLARSAPPLMARRGLRVPTTCLRPRSAQDCPW